MAGISLAKRRSRTSSQVTCSFPLKSIRVLSMRSVCHQRTDLTIVNNLFKSALSCYARVDDPMRAFLYLQRCQEQKRTYSMYSERSPSTLFHLWLWSSRLFRLCLMKVCQYFVAAFRSLRFSPSQCNKIRTFNGSLQWFTPVDTSHCFLFCLALFTFTVED